IGFWGKDLLGESARNAQRLALERLKGFLEHLQAFNSPGKLKNFRYDVQEVKGHEEGLKVLKEIESLQELVRDLEPVASYLSAAAAMLPPGHDWLDRVKAVREEVLAEVADPAKRS